MANYICLDGSVMVAGDGRGFIPVCLSQIRCHKHNQSLLPFLNNNILTNYKTEEFPAKRTLFLNIQSFSSYEHMIQFSITQQINEVLYCTVYSKFNQLFPLYLSQSKQFSLIKIISKSLIILFTNQPHPPVTKNFLA